MHFAPFLLGLWGVVNNAGIWYISELDMTPERIFRQVMEVNLFGTIRVTKMFLPLIKRSKGRVVNMGSVAGEEKGVVSIILIPDRVLSCEFTLLVTGECPTHFIL